MTTCNECRIGILHEKQITYVEQVGDQVLVFPNAPAESCDVCGITRYSADFMRHIHNLLSPIESPTRPERQDSPAALDVGSDPGTPLSAR